MGQEIKEGMKILLYKDYQKLRESIGKVQKSGTNPHFKNTFVELNTALDVVDDNIEASEFICFVQVPKTIDGKNYLNTKLVHNSGEFIESNLELITTKADPQMLGSSLTYARRYSLLTILGLQAVDDDGNLGAGKKEKKSKVHKDDTLNIIEAELNSCKDIGKFEEVKERLEKTKAFFKKKGQLQNIKIVEDMVEKTAERLK